MHTYITNKTKHNNQRYTYTHSKKTAYTHTRTNGGTKINDIHTISEKSKVGPQLALIEGIIQNEIFNNVL